MRLPFDPFRLLLIPLAGWLNRQQQDIIDYLQEEIPLPTSGDKATPLGILITRS